MRAAPHFKVEMPENDGFLVGDAKHVKIVDPCQSAVPVDGFRYCGIMIARQQHDRYGGSCHHRCGSLENMVRHAVAFERIAGKQHDIGVEAARFFEHTAKAGRPVAAVDARRVVMVHMQVGAVNDDDVPVYRRANLQRHAHLLPFATVARQSAKRQYRA